MVEQGRGGVKEGWWEDRMKGREEGEGGMKHHSLFFELGNRLSGGSAVFVWGWRLVCMYLMGFYFILF